jgi:hypothetical protein
MFNMNDNIESIASITIAINDEIMNNIIMKMATVYY